MQYEVVYNSDLIIVDRDVLSTMCVFYDKVYLPNTKEDSRGLFIELSVNNKRLPTGVAACSIEGLSFKDETGRMLTGSAEILQWEESVKVLFDESVLQRLGPPKDGPLRVEQIENVPLAALSLAISSARTPLRAFVYEGKPVKADRCIYLRQDHALHFARPDVDLPGVYVAWKGTSREIMKAVQAEAIFTYLLPALSQLYPEEILAVREKVKDTREGFSMHLQKLSKAIERQLKNEASVPEMSNYARSVVETELIPDYREFVRQLSAEKAGFWSKVLNKVKSLFEIDSPPWSLKFLADLATKLGFTALQTVQSRKDQLSNKSQTFHFMRTLERLGKNRVRH